MINKARSNTALVSDFFESVNNYSIMEDISIWVYVYSRLLCEDRQIAEAMLKKEIEDDKHK